MVKAKTEPEVGAVAEVKPEDTEMQAVLQAQIDKLTAELEAAQARIAELEDELAQATASPSESDVAPAEEYQAGGDAADDADVVAIKAKHGHAFWRSGYQIQPHFTFVKRADFEPEAWVRLLAEPMAVVREAVLPEQA